MIRDTTSTFRRAAMLAALGACLLVSPVDAAEPYDAHVLSEIADDVLRRGATGPDGAVVESVPPRTIADAAPVVDEGATASEAHIPPAQEGIFVAMPPGVAAPAKVDVAAGVTDEGYESNSFRQRSHAPRGLSFSSGTRTRTSGLDPTLRSRADGASRRGRRFVYGFLRLRVPLDEAVAQRLADFDVTLLGAHDDHQKARLPLASLEAIAALPEVEWVGVSTRAQKRSRELSALKRAADVARSTPIPIVVNLFEADEDGAFRRELEAAGVAVGEYDADLRFYRAVADRTTIDRIAGLDFVLFIELIEPIADHHDQSMALVDADLIRPGTPLGLTRYSGWSTLVGILDGGFMMGPNATVTHADLHKFTCGQNFTNEAGNAFHDVKGHGTHVIGTIAGTGSANPRYRGVAPGVGSIEQIRAAKVTDASGEGQTAWAESAMDFMSSFGVCTSAPPDVINVSNGVKGTGFTGTDSLSRKLDDKVWQYGQAYVVSAGNNGSGAGTIGRPGVAKNALTVGNVFDRQYLGVGDVANSSSRGPTGDGRMKPNVVAPGNIITSAEAGSTTSYAPLNGTSHATPHVTGLVATLMEHYSELKGRPALLRSHLMATAIAHDDVTGKSNDYGLGRVSGYMAHWEHPNSAGWTTQWMYGGVKGPGFAYQELIVPPNTKRLVVVLTWDEPAASAGASRAVTYDLDLWLDQEPYCMEEFGACGELSSRSDVDNVEYVVVNNPPAGTYRMKVVPVNGPTFPLRYGVTAQIIRGATRPAMTNTLTPPATPPLVGEIFEVKATVATQHYVASGVQVTPTIIPSGLTLTAVQTTRHDGVPMAFSNVDEHLTLGNLFPMYSRQVGFWFRADTPGSKTFFMRAWSENGGEIVANTTFQVRAATANLVPGGMGTSPATPTVTPGASFSVTDTVANVGPAASTSSKTRYYLSLDAVKGAGDTLLAGVHSVPGLPPGVSHSATVKVTLPANVPLDAYFLLACADEMGTVEEGDEADNCVASPGATVTVARPDLTVSGVSSPPASAKRGGKIRITDTAQNVAAVAAKSTKNRYYLSRDGVKSSGDQLLSGSRSVPELPAGAGHSGTVRLTVLNATPFDTYFVLACADDTSAVIESGEGNNCRPSAGTITIAP
jgi:hypothetical protein